MNEGQSRLKISKRGQVILIALPSGRRYLYFGWLLNFILLRTILKKKEIQMVHPWCTTAGTLGAIFKMLDRNIKLVIDSFEPHAEAMVENGSWKRSGIRFKALFKMEKKEATLADHLIFAAPGMEYYVNEKYKTKIQNYFVKPACTDLDLFSVGKLKNKELLLKYGLADKIICVYAGKFGGIYLEDETFGFIKCCEQTWGAHKFRFLLLSNVSQEYVQEKCAKFSIDRSVVMNLFVPHQEVPDYIGLADFALCPVKPVPTKKYCSPIKTGEYWALGLPVVTTPDISQDSAIISENHAGAVLKGFTEDDYKRAIEEINSIISVKSREQIYSAIRPLAEKYRNFKLAEEVYRKIYG